MSASPSFKDFFYSDECPDKLLAKGETSFDIAASAVADSLLPFSGEDRKKKFADEVTSIAHEEEFIAELSEKIGSPRPDETEDSFVKRSKSIMREILRSRLRKKA